MNSILWTNYIYCRKNICKLEISLFSKGQVDSLVPGQIILYNLSQEVSEREDVKKQIRLSSNRALIDIIIFYYFLHLISLVMILILLLFLPLNPLFVFRSELLALYHVSGSEHCERHSPSPSVLLLVSLEKWSTNTQWGYSSVWSSYQSLSRWCHRPKMPQWRGHSQVLLNVVHFIIIYN